MAETLADWQLESRRAATSSTRLGIALRGVLACSRILVRARLGLPGKAIFRSFGRDLVYATRRLHRTPLFTLFGIVSLALGIGGATAAFSAVLAATGPPPGIDDVDRLVRIRHAAYGSTPIIGLSWGDYEDLRARQTVFSGLAAWGGGSDVVVANGHGVRGGVASVSGDFFPTLRVRAVAGRLLQPGDDRLGARPVAVISYGLWQRVFAGSPQALGAVIKTGGMAFDIVGVADASFAGMSNGGLTPSIGWITFSAARQLPHANTDRFDPNQRTGRWLALAGRLRDDRSLAGARAEVTGIARQLDAEWPLGRMRDPRLPPSSHRDRRPWDVRELSGRVEAAAGGLWIERTGRALLVVVAIVLLIGCANLASLMLARHATRRQEFAVRLALGASRWRLVREVLAESILIAVLGGLAGLAISRSLIVLLTADFQLDGGRFFLRLAPTLDARVLAACGASTIGALLVFGVVPALRAARADARSAFGEDGAASVSGRWRGRRTLIALQVTVSAVMVSLATLYVAEIRAAARTETGVRTDRLAVMDVDFTAQGHGEAHARRVVEQVLSQVSSHPDAEVAAASSGWPGNFLMNPGGNAGADGTALTTHVDFLTATPALIDALGISLVHGRAFNLGDAAGGPPVAIVSQRAAMQIFGATDVVGRSLHLQRRRWAGESTHPVRLLTIVGVAGSPVSTTPESPHFRAVYVPWAQHYEGTVAFSVRTSGDPAHLLPVLREALRQADPEIAPTRVALATSLGSVDTLLPRITATLSSVFGSLAFALALTGLYGVLAHLVAGRTREIGIRLALGASAGGIRRQVLRQGMRPVLMGLVAGLSLVGLALVLLPPAFIRLLPGLDLAALITVPALFIAAGLAACYLPALRASRVDPNVALRNL